MPLDRQPNPPEVAPAPLPPTPDKRDTLSRFHSAQAQGVYESALAELRRGVKRGHWMWFIFPQLQGLARSATSRYYGISGAAEARHYLADPLLGPRLRECCEALLDGDETKIERVLGEVDAGKLRSSATLYAAVSGEEVFKDVLRRFYGEPCPRTVRILRGQR